MDFPDHAHDDAVREYHLNREYRDYCYHLRQDHCLPLCPPCCYHLHLYHCLPMLSDDVGSDKYDQRRYKKQKLRELYAGTHNRRIRTQNGGFGCPFCAQRLNPVFASVLAHARGRAVGSFKQKYSCRVAHAAYAEYLEKVYVVGGYN